MKKLLTTIYILLVLMTTLVRPAFTYAQEAALAISPALIELLVKPARTMVFDYSVKNSGDPTVMRLHMKSVEPDGDSGTVRLSSKSDDAIKFSIQDKRYRFDTPIILKAGQTLKISVEAQIAETVSGDHYYALIAQSDPPPIVEGGAMTRARLAIGSILLLSVAEDYPSDIRASIGAFRIHPARSYSFLGKEIEIIDSFQKPYAILSLSNASEHFIQVQGTIEFSGFGGKQAIAVPKTTILAESSRRIHELEKNREHSPRLLIGKYTSTARLRILENGKTITQKATIVVFPVKISVLLLLICIAGTIVMVRNYRMGKKTSAGKDKG